MNKKISTYLTFCLPVVLLASLLEAFLYDGFISNFLFIDIKIIIVTSIMTNWLFAKQSSDTEYITSFNRLIILPLSIALYLTLMIIEIKNATGYIFSSIHIHPEITLLTAIFSFGIFLSSKLPKPKLLNPTIIITSSIILYSFVSTVYFSSAYLPSFLHRLVGSDITSYRQRMKSVWGEFYDHVDLYRRTVPAISSIAHPPQENPWQMEGNQLLLRYFLYPRTLYSATNEDFYQSINQSDWVMITSGNSILYPSSELFSVWPIMPVPVNKVISLSPRKLNVTINNIIVQTTDGQDYLLDLPENIITLGGGDGNALDTTYKELSIDNMDSVDIVKASLDSNLSFSTNFTVRISQPGGMIVEYEGNPNTVIDQLTTIELNIADLRKNLSDDQNISGVYLRFTSMAPLPYLYGEAIASIGVIEPDLSYLSSESLSNLGSYHYSSGEFARARELYQQALVQKASNLEAILGLYYLSNHDQNYMEARQYASLLSSLLTHENLNLGDYLLTNMKVKK